MPAKARLCLIWKWKSAVDVDVEDDNGGKCCPFCATTDSDSREFHEYGPTFLVIRAAHAENLDGIMQLTYICKYGDWLGN